MLFVGTLFSRKEFYPRGRERLISLFGPVLMETPAVLWDYSTYYREELGWPILRRFLFFERPVGQDKLGEIKLETNALEAELSSDGKRNINLDPGYLTLAKVVLASTKDYSHRIYLGRGIYAEVTLVYRAGEFHPYVNTYRDYRDYAGIFLEARDAFEKMATPPSY